MRLSFVAPLFLAASLAASAQQAMPRVTSVDPDDGKAGDVITAAGEHLEKSVVAKLYLTDGKNDVVAEMTEQTATSIKFKIPAKAAPGRFALMLLTTGKEPKLIEQPVKLTVDEGS
jgi:nitrous oxidase accessory protein NosD